MSIQSALKFISAARERPELAARVRALGADVELEQLAELAREEGFEFTADELQSAHTHDWSLRWVRFEAPST